jgi:AmmeMemoRadiSam system protein A
MCKNMTKTIRPDEGEQLLKIAREAIRLSLKNEPLPTLRIESFPLALRDQGACFVKLKLDGVLRGCVGSIQATDPLVIDVQKRAVAAAFHDPRFSPIEADEFSRIKLEISCLTTPEPLQYHRPEDLSMIIRPGVDGLILNYHFRRATFLPSVWEQLSDPEVFLGRLCQKMGVPPNTWRNEIMDAEIYQAVKFSEDD